MKRAGAVLISGYYGAGNLGDEALLAGLVRGLSARGHRVEVLSADPGRTRAQHGVAASHRLRGLVPAVMRCRALVSGGGGLLQDVTSRRSLRYFLGVIGLARRLRTPVVVYGQSLGPLSEGGARRVAAALAGIPLGLRDRPSLELAAAWGRPATAVADPALALRPPGRAGGETLLLVPRGGHPAVTEALVALARRARARGRPVATMALHEDVDASEARAVAGAAPDVTLWQADEPRQALARVAAAGFVVSGRLHGLVLATLAGVGHAGLAYDPKVRGFLQDSGGACFELPLAEEELASLAALAEQRAAADPARREALLRRCQEGLDWLDGRLRASAGAGAPARRAG